MLKKPLFWETIIFFAIAVALHIVATVFHLYWSIYEFDSLTHFFFGAALAFLFLWFYFFSGFFGAPPKNFARFLLISFFGAISVALLWESYELIFKQTMVQKADYPYDTMMDLIMDFLGAVAACLYGYFKVLGKDNG